MAKSYKHLRGKLSSSAQAKADAKAKVMMREMVLQDLRQEMNGLVKVKPC